MLKNAALLWAIILVLLAGLGFMVKTFILTGNTIASKDDRTAILVTSDERIMILGEMRAFLETVQGVTESLAENDLARVAELATTMGETDPDMAPSLMGKLPIEFKQLGFATHGLFTDLGKTAQGGDQQAVLASLGDLMINCTTCHAENKFVVEGSEEAMAN